MKNYTGYQGTYYEGVSTEKEKYVIPEAFVLDYEKSGNQIMIYGLMSDNDPRLSTTKMDASTMLIRISDVINPNQAYKNSDLKVSVKHSRYTYKDGPELVIHDSDGTFNFADTITTGSAS